VAGHVSGRGAIWERETLAPTAGPLCVEGPKDDSPLLFLRARYEPRGSGSAGPGPGNHRSGAKGSGARNSLGTGLGRGRRKIGALGGLWADASNEFFGGTGGPVGETGPAQKPTGRFAGTFRGRAEGFGRRPRRPVGAGGAGAGAPKIRRSDPSKARRSTETWRARGGRFGEGALRPGGGGGLPREKAFAERGAFAPLRPAGARRPRGCNHRPLGLVSADFISTQTRGGARSGWTGGGRWPDGLLPRIAPEGGGGRRLGKGLPGGLARGNGPRHGFPAVVVRAGETLMLYLHGSIPRGGGLVPGAGVLLRFAPGGPPARFRRGLGGIPLPKGRTGAGRAPAFRAKEPPGGGAPFSAPGAGGRVSGPNRPGPFFPGDGTSPKTPTGARPPRNEPLPPKGRRGLRRGPRGPAGRGGSKTYLSNPWFSNIFGGAWGSRPGRRPAPPRAREGWLRTAFSVAAPAPPPPISGPARETDSRTVLPPAPRRGPASTPRPAPSTPGRAVSIGRENSLPIRAPGSPGAGKGLELEARGSPSGNLRPQHKIGWGGPRSPSRFPPRPHEKSFPLRGGRRSAPPPFLPGGAAKPPRPLVRPTSPPRKTEPPFGPRRGWVLPQRAGSRLLSRRGSAPRVPRPGEFNLPAWQVAGAEQRVPNGTFLKVRPSPVVRTAQRPGPKGPPPPPPHRVNPTKGSPEANSQPGALNRT